jgi:hypothetical protein
MANAHVAMLRPYLARHGVAYERQKFQERLRTGDVRLDNTTAWIKEVRPGLGLLFVVSLSCCQTQ